MLFYFYILLLVVGIAQISGFLIRLFSMKSKPSAYRQRLKTYGLLVLVYFLLLTVASLLEMNEYVNWSEGFIIVYIFIVPILLAVFYWNAVYRKYDRTTGQEKHKISKNQNE